MEKEDIKTLANSLARLMEMADTNITKAGGAIACERLIDYCSDELRRLSDPLKLKVFAELDKDFEKKLLRDELGEMIGFVYSKKIFVSVRAAVGSAPLSAKLSGAAFGQSRAAEKPSAYASKFAGPFAEKSDDSKALKGGGTKAMRKAALKKALQSVSTVKPDKTEKSDKSDKSEKSEKAEKSEKSDRAEKSEKPDTDREKVRKAQQEIEATWPD